MEPPPYRFVELAPAPMLEITDELAGMDEREGDALVQHWDTMVFFKFPTLRFTFAAPFANRFLLITPKEPEGFVADADIGPEEWEAFVNRLVKSLPGQSADTRDYLLTHLPMNSVAGMVDLCERVSKYPPLCPADASCGYEADAEDCDEEGDEWVDGRGRKAHGKPCADVEEFFHKGAHTQPDGDRSAPGV